MVEGMDLRHRTQKSWGGGFLKPHPSASMMRGHRQIPFPLLQQELSVRLSPHIPKCDSNGGVSPSSFRSGFSGSV